MASFTRDIPFVTAFCVALTVVGLLVIPMGCGADRNEPVSIFQSAPPPAASPAQLPIPLPEPPPAPKVSVPPQTASAPRHKKTLMEVTAYCPCRECCGRGAKGITASGKRVHYNRSAFVAADDSLPFYTRLSIPGYHGGKPVPVMDRGGAIVGNKLDVYFPSHKEAKKWGRRQLLVTVYE